MSFKRSAASAVAAGLILTGVAAPHSHAVTVKVNSDGACVMTFSAQEQRSYNFGPSATATIAQIKESIAVSEKGLQDAKKLRASATNPRSIADYDELVRQAEGILKTMKSGLAQCENAQSPGKPKPKPNPNPKPKPGQQDPQPNPGDGEGSSSDNGTNPDEGDGKNALSTEDGKLNDAGIGVVVAGVLLVVLGGIAAALPTLKPMLPAYIAAMLP